jgi:hypothetical protein
MANDEGVSTSSPRQRVHHLAFEQRIDAVAHVTLRRVGYRLASILARLGKRVADLAVDRRHVMCRKVRATAAPIGLGTAPARQRRS